MRPATDAYGVARELAHPVEQDARLLWLEARRTGIGGSDVAAICGLDPYGRTAADVYDEKVGAVADRQPTPAMQRGALLEPVAAAIYAERTGRALRRQPLRRHPEHEWMIGNVDRQILAGHGGVTSTGVLEVKCPGIRQFAKVKANGLPEAWILQIQHYLAVYGYSWGSFAVFNAEAWELIHFDIAADAALIERLIEIEHDFWHNHVLAGVRPEPAPVELPKLPEVSGQVVTRDDPEWADAIAMLAEAKELKASAEEIEAAAKERIQALAGGYGVFEGAGARVYWRMMPGRKSFDKRALAAARPLNRVLVREILQQHGIGRAVIDRIEAEAVLDLDAFEKEGNPYAEFRCYFLAGAGEE